MLYEIIIKQYESAKLDEARESLMVQVINEAKPPARPARPKTLLVCLIVAGAALFLFIFLAFLMEFLGNISREESQDSKRLNEIKKLVRRF